MSTALEIIVRAGCGVNKADKNGAAPADVAAQKGHTTALEVLVKADCDGNQASAKDGSTLADLATQQDHTAALATATLEENDSMSKRKEKNRKHNVKKKEQKKARADAIEEGAVEEGDLLRRSEGLAPELAFEVAPSSATERERPEADSADWTLRLRVGGVENAERDDEEVELCRCSVCIELENALGVPTA
jgi:hypothetical protein